MLSIASAVLGFGSYPEPDAAECTGHTGDLAVLHSFTQGSFGCESVAPGYDPTAPWSCENPDGTDNILVLTVGDYEYSYHGGLVPVGVAEYSYRINTKDVCPETCGVPCAHAPTEDADDDFMMGLTGRTCAGLLESGECEWIAAAAATATFPLGLTPFWFCGASCGGYDECSHPSGAEIAMDQCWLYVNQFMMGLSMDQCEADALNLFSETPEDYPCIGTHPVVGQPGGIPGWHPDPEYHYCELGPAAKGSTEIYNCPA